MHINKNSKGSSLRRFGDLPRYQRFVWRMTKGFKPMPYRLLTATNEGRVKQDGSPRSKSYKAVYGRIPRRLREAA